MIQPMTIEEIRADLRARNLTTFKERPLIDARTARAQVVGMQKWVVWMSGGEMRDDVAANEILVGRIDELEDALAVKDAYIERLTKALANVGAVLEDYTDDPFEAKPMPKWNKGELGKRILAMVDSIKWVVTRAENELDPRHAVPLLPGPRD